jgi:hypothetical protein
MESQFAKTLGSTKISPIGCFVTSSGLEIDPMQRPTVALHIDERTEGNPTASNKKALDKSRKII